MSYADSEFHTNQAFMLGNACPASRSGDLCASCQNARILEARIAKVGAPSKDFQEEYRQVRTEMNLSHNPVVLQVPPEITSAIFELFMPAEQEFRHDHDSVIGQGWKKLYAPPLVLGKICRGWRERAWATPHIWTYIIARLDELSEWQVRFVRDWLVRSGGLPISVHAYEIQTYGDQPDRRIMADTLIDLLAQQSYRWHTLSLSLTEQFIDRFMGNRIFSDPAIIRNVLVRSLSEMEDGSVQGVVKLKPTRVSLYECLLETVPMIEWGHVTELEVRISDATECLLMLKYAIRLEKASFTAIEPSAPLIHGSTLVDHLTLRSLKIQFQDIDAAATFFDNVTLSALETLVLETYFDSTPIDRVVAFLLRSSCRLKEFVLLEFCCSYEELLPIFLAIPYVEYLFLQPSTRSVFENDHFLRHLGESAIASAPLGTSEGLAGATRPSLLPCLRTLRLHLVSLIMDWTNVQLVYGPLDRISDTRRRPLRTLRLHFIGPIFTDCSAEWAYLNVEDFLPHVQAVVEAGLELRITWGHTSLDLIAKALNQQRDPEP